MAAVEAAEAAGLDREHGKVLAQHVRPAPMATSTTLQGSAVPAVKLVDAICARMLNSRGESLRCCLSWLQDAVAFGGPTRTPTNRSYSSC